MNRKQPTIQDLLRRIDELEKRVKELGAQPREQHFHYHPPVYQSPYTPYVSPAAPVPQLPYKITIGDPIPNPWPTTTATWPNAGGSSSC